MSFSANPDQQEIVCNNYSSSLLPSADGTTLLEVATRRQADGSCAAFFATGSAKGTGDATGVVSGSADRLASVISGLCLDDTGGSMTAGTKLQQWNCNSLDPQNWKLTNKGSGYFTLVNEQSGLCLDVPGGSTTKGVQVQQWGCNGTNAQLWRAVNVGRGVYNFVSKVNGLCLDVAGGSTMAGTAVQQWTCNSTAAQIWDLERAQKLMPLGDSITDGLNGTGGYRSDLWQALTSTPASRTSWDPR